MKCLTFDNKKHEYTLNGSVVPGVTTVLRSVGISDFSNIKKSVLDYACQKGTAIHLACEYYDKNILGDVPAVIDLYFKQWCLFCDKFKPDFLEIENRVFCDKFKYAGTIDRIALIKGELVLIDIKSGAKSKSHQIQTSAYERAYFKNGRKKIKRWCVYLTEKKYTIVEHKNDTDFDVFLNALAVYNYKHNQL